MFLLGPVAMFTPIITANFTILTKIVVFGIVGLIALCIWAFCLKVITVTDQGVEVKRLCLPFLKRFYRMAEFDSYVIEPHGNVETFHLISQGRRIISIRSNLYDNYIEVAQALSVVGQKEWGADASRAVYSKFTKGTIAAPFVAFLFVLIYPAIPVCEYFEHGQITHKSWLILSIGAIVFTPVLMYALHCCKRLTIWHDHLEVRSMLCPWKVGYYALNEFDMALKVITNNGQGMEDTKSLWLIREGKLAISISQSSYVNYDDLEHAIGIEPYQVRMSWFKKIRYYLGKTIDI